MRERMSLSKYKSNKWTTHFARFARALLGPCSDVLREVLAKETSPFDLEKKVKSYISLKKKPSIRDDHEQLVYGKDYSVFDITLLYFLFRNMCSIKPHKKNWGNDPEPTDKSLSANIERIRILRNDWYGHATDFSLTDSDFAIKWNYISQIVKELEGYLGTGTKYQDTLIILKTCLMDPESIKLFKDTWLTDVKNLEEGFGELQTDVTNLKEGFGELQTDNTNIKVGFGDLQTDVTDLKVGFGELQTDNSNLKEGFGELQTDVTYLKEGFGELKTDVTNLKKNVEEIKKSNKISTTQELSLDQEIFEQWQEENSKFLSTRACKEVEKLIKSQNLVVVTGNSGSGKSAIIQHVALSYRSDGWTVKPVESVKEVIDAFPPPDDLNRGTLLVFNDPIGNESFDEEKNKLWKDHKEKLKGCLRKIKMLVSCRRYILNDARVRGILKDTSCIIDLGDDQHKLDNEEKQNILEKYSEGVLSKEDINKIIKTEEYFPLLCKLYFSDKNEHKRGLQFFEEPVKVCEDEINYFRKECKENYCALVLLVLCNNQLCVEDIQKDDRLREKFELALKLCEMKTNTAPHTIGDTLKNLVGFFVKKIGDTYHFYHDFVMEVTTYVFGTDYPTETIQYADIGFLRRRVNLESSDDNRKEEVDIFTIYLNDKYVSDLADRLFNDVFGDRLLDVVLNPCVRNEKVATCFIQKLKECPKKLHDLLAKKKLHEELRKQKNNQELKQSFGSKLEFLFYEYEVQILSAIIVFCHTNISKHCLETLQQMQNSLKDTSFFSAVCCNGSIDLFNVFPKEEVKWFLVKKWGEYYPIHIVSEFHNHEILRELIQVENNVNLRTIPGYQYTPLMLAAFNMDTSEQKNKETRNQSIDITVELLLTHGADINECNLFFGTPLHMASCVGSYHTVELLLDKGADINLCDIIEGETPLHKACKWGNDSTVQLLLKKGANINSCDSNMETPLYIACERGHQITVQLLLEKGAEITMCDTNKETLLLNASESGHESTVQCLLEKGANINSCDTNKETPLHKASEEGHESTVQLLIEKGADINSCDTNKETPLHKASEGGHESTVQLLLEKGADINSCDTNKKTPLHKASMLRSEGTVQLLLDKGAAINVCDINNETPLHKASKWGCKCTVQLLLEKGANINSSDTGKRTPLHKAVECFSESNVQFLLDNGADINSFDTNKETPLHKAIKWGHDRMVQLLLEKGADINSCDTNEETPLHKASEGGHESTVQLLLEKGADINSCDTNKETPLHKASEGGHESTVQLLLEKGADINSCDRYDQTPLHKASLWGHDSTLQLLLNNGANINSCDRYVQTPLHKASKWGCESTVQLLLEKGANYNVCDENEETPLHKACDIGHDRIVQLLLDKGADINSYDNSKETPLQKANRTGHESTVQLLLDKGAEIISCDTK